jgi:hypothetical protein
VIGAPCIPSKVNKKKEDTKAKMLRKRKNALKPVLRNVVLKCCNTFGVQGRNRGSLPFIASLPMFKG